MDKWEGYIKYASILIIYIFLDLVVFSPIIEDAVELGLNSEMTVGGVTAPAKDLLDPIVFIFYRLMWHIIGISGWFGIIMTVQTYLKRIKII